MARGRSERRLTAVEPSPHADPHEVAEFAETLPERFLHCRDTGHSWRQWAADGPFPDGGWTRILRCTVCRTERHQDITSTGVVVANKLVYPDGYLAPKGFGRMTAETRGVMRVTALTRGATKVSRARRSA